MLKGKKAMKRIIAYILLAALALNSMGCGKMTAHERKKVVCAKTQYEPGNELECDRLFISREDILAANRRGL
jgi:hypothetical protein